MTAPGYYLLYVDQQPGSGGKVMQPIALAIGGARQYAPVFRDSCRGPGAVFSQTSLIDGPTQLLISPSEHGTIIPLTDDHSAALVYRAVAAARSN
jgi:hypothetical protein